MIVVEGPDGAGKTTLCHKLANDLHLQVRRWGMARADLPNVNVRERVYQALSEALRGPVYIRDRLFFSELVYGPAIRGECMFTPREENFIRRVMMAMGHPLIMCRPPLEAVVANIRSGDHMEGVTPEVMPEIYERYSDTLPLGINHHNVMFWDFTKGEEDPHPGSFVSYETILKVCERYLERRAERTA